MIITIFFISIKVIVFIALIKYLDVYDSGCMAYMCLISPLLPKVLERNLGRLVPVGSCGALWRPGREPVFYMWRHIVEHQNLYSEAFLWNWDCDDNEIMNMTNMIVRHSSPRHSSPQTFITPWLNSDIHHLGLSSPLPKIRYSSPRHSSPQTFITHSCRIRHSSPRTFITSDVHHLRHSSPPS